MLFAGFIDSILYTSPDDPPIIPYSTGPWPSLQLQRRLCAISVSAHPIGSRLSLCGYRRGKDNGRVDDRSCVSTWAVGAVDSSATKGSWLGCGCAARFVLRLREAFRRTPGVPHPPQDLKRRFRGVIGGTFPSLRSPREPPHGYFHAKFGSWAEPFEDGPSAAFGRVLTPAKPAIFSLALRLVPGSFFPGHGRTPLRRGTEALCGGSRAQERPPDLPSEPPLTGRERTYGHAPPFDPQVESRVFSE
jgi:hypothetical protein